MRSVTTRQRLFDIAAASVGVAVFAGPISLVALAIRLDDGGPVFFPQERVGLGRARFRVYKLRTMNDGKVTRVGRWLRPTGIDETPQFWNVLRGQMRMVGPRPLTPDDVVRFGYDTAESDGRYGVPPGITGLAQVWGGRSTRETRRLDALYANRSTLGGDTLLIALSFGMNLFGKRRVRDWMKRARRRRRDRRLPRRRYARAVPRLAAA
jgi:lipopolysaccharide/colanic/teichoic acid biosynthesis glycosyltransferase